MATIIHDLTSEGDGFLRVRRMRLRNSPMELLRTLNNFRKDGSFCDVTLLVDGEEFPAHKCILASFSPYFQSMFLSGFVESYSKTVTIHGIDASTMKILLDFAYTFDLTPVTCDNVLSVLQAASLIQVNHIVSYCCSMLRDNAVFDIINSLSIYVIADLLCEKALKEIALRFLVQNFLEISTMEEFLQLSPAQLIDILLSNYIKVNSEDDILDAALQWINFNKDRHQKHIKSILEKVRWEVVSLDRLQRIINNGEEFAMCPSETVDWVRRIMHSRTSGEVLEAPHLQIIERRRAAQHEVAVMIQPKCTGGLPFDLVSCEGKFIQKLSQPETMGCIIAVICSYENLFIADHDHSQRRTSIWRFDSRDGIWTVITKLRKTPSKIVFAEADGFLYVCRQHPCRRGSESGHLKSFISVYNIASQEWKTFIPKRITATKPVITVLDGMLYFIAKHSPNDATATVSRFDPKSGVWTDVSPVSVLGCVDKFDVCSFEHRIFIYARGCSGANKNIAVYHPAANEWSVVKVPLEFGYITQLAVFEGALTAFLLRYQMVCRVHRYNVTGDFWVSVSCFPVNSVQKIAGPLHYTLLKTAPVMENKTSS